MDESINIILGDCLYNTFCTFDMDIFEIEIPDNCLAAVVCKTQSQTYLVG